MGEPALKLPKLDRLKAAAEAEWKALGKELIAQQQCGVRAEECRQQLGYILTRLRREVEHKFAKPASTGGRPKTVWWEWFEEWQPPGKWGSISRDEATRAMQIAGAKDPDEAEQNFRARKRRTEAKRSQLSRDRTSPLSQESPLPAISLAVRQIEGMIRKLSCEDRETLFNRIKDLLP